MFENQNSLVTHYAFDSLRRKGNESTLRDMWPSMVTHTLNLCSAFNPSMCTHTHTVVNTHTLTHTHTHTHTRTPGAVGSHIAVVPRKHLCVRCLVQGSHLSHGIEGGESAVQFAPPSDNSCLEPATTTTGPEEEPEHMNNLVVNWSTLIALNILHLVMQ